MKIRNSRRQNAEKNRPEVEKRAPEEYITKEFYSLTTTKKEVQGSLE